MEPITTIATAIALGATAALRDTAATAIKDAYQALKHYLVRQWPESERGVRALEASPHSSDTLRAVESDLVAAGAAEDATLVSLAVTLMNAIGKAVAQGAVVGVDLDTVRGTSLRLDDIQSSGIGVRVRDGQVSGDISITNVRAGVSRSDHPNA